MGDLTGAKPEVARVVIEKNPEHPEPTRSLSAADNLALERNRTAVLAHQRHEARPVGGRVLSRQVSDDTVVDQDTNGVGVVWVIRLRHEHGLDGATNSFSLKPARELPKMVLV